jgi:RNA polymerase sigma-70 factor (ECF subfamily)
VDTEQKPNAGQARSPGVGAVTSTVVRNDGQGVAAPAGRVPQTKSGEPTLESLMSEYVNGNPDGFDHLYRRISPKLFGYLLRLTRNRERAEDLLQTTFTKVHRARASYLEGAPLLPWVLAIARRSFYDERRASRARHEQLSYDGELPEPPPEEPKLRSDAAETLEHALDGLPEAYREAIQLTKITGLSLNEAAEVLGTTPTAVKLRVHRGYVALRKSLDQGNSSPLAGEG